MPLIKSIFFCGIFLSSAFAQAVCQDLNVEGFGPPQLQNGVKVLLNHAKTATIAVNCVEGRVDLDQALGNLAKTGEFMRLDDGLYAIDTKAAGGVVARSYVKIGQSTYQLGLVTTKKNASQIPLIQKKILAALAGR